MLYTYSIHMAQHPVIRINLDSDVPAQRQIVDNVRVLLVEGTLRPGDSLPSVRRLAMELGVHFNTVAQAYRELAAEGWIDLKHGRGAEVVERAPTPPSREQIADFRLQLRQMVARMRAQGLSTARIAAELHAIEEDITQ